MAFSGVAQNVFLQTGFESGIPAGWTQEQITGTVSWTTQSGGTSDGGAGSNPSSAHSGSNNAILFYPANDMRRDTRLITPSFSTTGYTNLTLDFWHAQESWFGDQDTLKVFYSTNGGSTWTQLAYYTENVAAWTQRSLTIPTASADTRIAFEGSATWGHGVCLDDILVSGIPDTFSEVFVSATDADASEMGPDAGTWTITRTGNTTGPLSVNYTLSGNAAAGSDYNVNIASPISFAAGETSKVITLTPIDDEVGAEGNKIATLTLISGTGYAIGEPAANISIYDDEGFDLNILIIGSTRSFSDGGENDVLHEKAFNPSTIATHLESIIDQDPAISDTVNVVFEDIFKTKTNFVQTSGTTSANITEHCYSLAQHYFWPEGKAERLANLRGEDGTEWDYIILCSDPYIMANFPGIHAEGVRLIQNEVARSANPAQVVLLAQWPENSSTFTADDFNEIVHRIGGSAGLTVVPAGKVWDSYPSQDTDAAHPTPKGAYLAASSIYSTFYNRSAKSSNYSFPSDGDAMADHALAQVQAIASVPQYTGAYTTVNTFQMKYVTKRVVQFRETGTSTEDRIRFALDRLDDVQRITLATTGYSDPGGTRWDFNYGRGNDGWEDDKDYEVDPAKYDRSYGFPMHYYNTSTAPLTMPYGIDKHYFGSTYEDGTDLGIAYNMVRPNTRETGLPEGHDVRAIPIRLLWLKMEQMSPGLNPLGDSTHMNNHLNDATAAFMYTLLSGRCPVVEEPATAGSTEWLQWLGHKIGYETAWQMAHLTTRAPGFRVLPSSTSATTVTPTTSETMTVQFMNAPLSDVTVTVSASEGTAAIVSPTTLTFTPSNYNTPQEVTVIGLPGASSSEPFAVVFSTSSNDEIYDGLSDAWSYTTTRSSTTTVTQVNNGTSPVATAQFTTLDIDLGVAGANSGNTTFAGPSHGSITWGGTQDIQYTPTSDYVGSDQIVYAVTIDGTQIIGTIDISVQLPDGQVNASASDAQASEEGPDTGTFTISRLGDTTDALDVFFTLGGTATFGDDYALSHTSPVTIPAGQSSIEITLPPVDDDVFGEQDESVVLTITEDPAYPVGIASVTITIADNDNRTPTVDAGEDQSTQLSAATPVPGLSYGTVPGDIDLTTPNPETQILVNPSVETENTIAGNTTEIYTGFIYDADGQISFTEHIDDRARIWIDDFLVLSNDTWNARSSSGNLNLAPGWHSIEIRISNGTGGSGPVNGEIGIGYDPAGGTAWQVLTDPGDGSFLRVNQVVGVDINLTGTAGDPDNDLLVATWTVESGPAPVTFANPDALSTTATFTTSGIYVLRLTVNDGTESVFDDVTITISEGGDTAPPTVLTLDPAHTSGDVSPTANLSITFNEDVAFGTGSITLHQSGGTLVESFDVGTPPAGLSLSGDTVTINPTADLAASTTYYLEVDATAIDDLAGNSFAGFSGDGTWSFTTATPDLTAPQIQSLSPTNGTLNVGLSADLTITFDENVALGTGSIALRQSGGSLIESFDVGVPASGLSIDGASITIDPTSNLSASTTYYLEIDATAIDDLAGNSFAGFSGSGTWNFTTAAAPAVTIALDFGTPTSNVQTGYTGVSTNGGSNDGTALVGGNISVSYPAGQTLHHRDRGQTGSFTDLTHLDLLRDIIYFDGMSTSDVFTFTISGLSPLQEYEVYGYAVDMFGATTNDNKTVSWTTSGGTVQHTTDSGNEDLASARFQMANMTANANGEATITAQYVAGGSSIILWNGFDIVAITGPAPTFNSWISGFNNLGSLTAFSDDADGDGDTNGEEAYFGTHPGETSRSLSAGEVNLNGGTTFTFTHPVNANPVSGITATYIWSTDLATFYANGLENGRTTVTFSAGDPDENNLVTVTATVSGTAVERLFVDVDVVEN